MMQMEKVATAEFWIDRPAELLKACPDIEQVFGVVLGAVLRGDSSKKGIWAITPDGEIYFGITSWDDDCVVGEYEIRVNTKTTPIIQ